MYHIKRLALALLPVMLTVAFATAQTFTVYQGATTELEVEQKGNDTYTWDLYNTADNVNFATDGPNILPGEADFIGGNTGPKVTVQWLQAGTYFFRVMAVDEVACTNNLRVGMIEVLASRPTADIELSPNEICISEPATITVNLTGHPAWSFDLEAEDADGVIETKTYEDIGENDLPYEIEVSPDQTTIYRIINLKDRYGESLDPSNSVELTVHPLPQMSPIYLKVD